MYAVNKFHPFNDGNKRSSLILGTFFWKSMVMIIVLKFVQEMEEIVVWLAESKIKDDLLLEIISSIINEDEFSESLKLKIIESVGL